ncbi:hypothetical protein A9Q91_01640 [Candidatus Gracilibacteria bacterium 28_42_T64]|nr:hypothetical protein A9Q91_01640 [Candidatus Gracilibacteria bacterium 28_42_T64]
MKQFTSVDTKTDIEKEDCFYLRNIGNEQFELAIAVAKQKGFQKNRKQAACIVLRLILTEKGVLVSSRFTNEEVILKKSHNFTEYNIILENYYGTKRYFFLETLLRLGSNAASKFLKQDSAEDLVECLMALFTHHAKKKYKINCKDYGRRTSPKNNKYRIELSERIEMKKNKKSYKKAA